MTSQAQTKEKAIEAAESLLGYPDTKVKATAQTVADYLRHLPVGVDEFLGTVAPEGSAMARIEFRLSRLCARGQLYEFRRAIRIIVARSEGYFVAWSNSFLVHGTGDSVDEALRDYMEEWHRHYQWLHEESERLAPPLEKELAKIQRILIRQPDAA